MQAVTIDVEDYYSLIVRDTLGLTVPISGYVDLEMNRMLDLLDELEVKATCFVGGKLAKERPHIPRAIVARKHEVASHSFDHLRMQAHNPKTFREDLRASIQTL